MAKKNTTSQDVFVQDTVSGVEMTEALDRRFVTYAFMSLEDRALPDARDGLKPSQRRILVAMNDLNLTARSSTEKCAKICGDTSGNYHPHGEAIVYPTLVRLAQGWVMRNPLVLGQGNFGNIDGDPPAAMRYTEAKMSLVGEAMLQDLSPEVVPFVPNYNEKRQEPTILPAKFPNLLVNGAQGIAVGWSTTLPPHNLREVVAVVRAYIKNPDMDVSEVISLMPGPDFPTGGKILGQDGVIEYYRTGRGSVKMEGRWEIRKPPRGNESIVITELPYQASPEQLAVEIEALVRDGKIPGISDLKNLSSKKTGIQVVVEVGRGQNTQLVVNSLLKYTSLRKSFSVNQTVLIGGKVVPDAGVLKLVAAFVEHRTEVLTSKYKANLAKELARIHILEGLIRVSNSIDETIRIIRASETPEKAAVALIEAKLCESEAQAKAVLAITLSQLTRLEATKLEDEKKKREERVEWLRNVLSSRARILEQVSKEQAELAEQMGTDRKTEIVKTVVDIDNEDLIKNEQLIVTLTGEGYVKSAPVDTYRVQKRGGKGVIGGKESDDVFDMFEAGSKDVVLFFTNRGLMYRRKAYEIPQGSRTAKGMHVSNLLSLSEGEFVTNMIALKSFEQKGYLVFATQKGLIKRSDISEYDTNRINTGLTAIKIEDGDEVAFVMVTDGKRDVFILTANGYAVRYHEDLVRSTGRQSYGVTALKLEDGDSIAQVLSLDPDDAPDIVIMTATGQAKRTKSDEYRALSGRNVRGYAAMNREAARKYGGVVGAAAVGRDESLLVLTEQGKVVRINAKDIRETGRATGGVRGVRLNDGDSVSRVARLSKIAEEMESEEEAAV